MSQADVLYSCGACGYELNLSSANRMTNNISGYREFIKQDSISFQSVDLSRFTQVDVAVSCLPISLGRKGTKTKLIKCRQCGVLIGYGYGYKEGRGECEFDQCVRREPSYEKIKIKIRAIQPMGVQNVQNEAGNGNSQ